MTQFFKEFVEETTVTKRRTSKKYTAKAEREKISRKENRRQKINRNASFARHVCSTELCADTKSTDK